MRDMAVGHTCNTETDEPLELDARHLRLLESPREHGLEVGRCRRQHHFVGGKELLLHLEYHVREHAVRTHHVHHLQGLLGVIGHAEGHVIIRSIVII